MRDEEIQVFLDAVVHYFRGASGDEPVLGSAIERGEPSIVLEYTGVIGVSGALRGAVYFTAEDELLDELLQALKQPDRSQDAKTDLAGEVANTIAGFARRHFGGAFLLSVPVALRGRPQDLAFPRHMVSTVLPITWRDRQAYLILCLAQRSERLQAARPGDSSLGETQPLRPFDDKE